MTLKKVRISEPRREELLEGNYKLIVLVISPYLLCYSTTLAQKSNVFSRYLQAALKFDETGLSIKYVTEVRLHTSSQTKAKYGRNLLFALRSAFRSRSGLTPQSD